MKLYVLAGALTITLLACSNDEVSGTTDSSETSTTDIESSSDLSDLEQTSSSSSKLESSSSTYQTLCKASGGRGCSVTGFGDLWGLGFRYVLTNTYADDSSKFGNRAGELFFETGSEDGANTTVEWNDGRFISEFGEGALSANVWLDKGNMSENPFFNIGFNVAGYDSNGIALSADVSKWNGICVVINYGFDKHGELSLQLDIDNKINEKACHVLPSVALKATESAQCFEWKDFKVADSETDCDLISGEDAAKHVKRIIFHFQSTTEKNTLAFEFLAIGTNRDE